MLLRRFLNFIFCFLPTFISINCDISEDSSISSQIWCPEGFYQVDPENNLLECAAELCPRFQHDLGTSEDDITNISTFQNQSLDYNCSENANLKLPTCRRVALSSRQFKFIDNASIYEYSTEKTYPFGDYMYYPAAQEAWICRDEVLTDDDVESVILSCATFKIQENDYEILPNGSIYLLKANRLVRRGFYREIKRENDTVVDEACLYLNAVYENCHQFLPFEKHEFYINDLDFSLVIPASKQPVYPVGDYALSADGSEAYICGDVDESHREETQILYGVTSVISAFFSFVTLLAHLFYPKLNYHAKALFCHILSLFIMFLVMSIKRFNNYYPNDAARLTVFAFHYIFSLSTFLWLNVLAYELWKVFATIRGAPGSIYNDNNKKRWFVAKCCYAWGLPLLLCFLLISLSYNEKAARNLELDLSSPGSVWLDSHKSILMWLYGPIVIILSANTIFFILTIHNIKKSSKGTKILNKKVSKKLFSVFVKLFVVMGVFWFFEVISWALERHTDESVWYATDLINGLEGVAIFFIYVCKKSTWKVIKKRWTVDDNVSINTRSTNSSVSNKRRTVDSTEMTTRPSAVD